MTRYRVTYNFLGRCYQIVEADSPEEAADKAMSGALMDDEIISVVEEFGQPEVDRILKSVKDQLTGDQLGEES